MDKSRLHLVVIAGGSGTRFWPKSTSRRPKQLLSFGGKGGKVAPSLLAQTIIRFDGLVPAQQRIIVTTQLLQDTIVQDTFVKDAIAVGRNGVQVLAEPTGRNTAPCIYWAARTVAANDPQGVMLIMPADHYIARVDQFVSAVEIAARWAYQKDDLVTLGIRPTRPETGYGYLKLGDSLNKAVEFDGVRRVEEFVEKPNQEKAQEFFEDQNYLWNGGMFLWRAEVILKAFDQYMPEMREAWETSEGKVELAYPRMTATSIDYGVMERARNVVTFPLDCGWDDVGNWTSLENLAGSLGAQAGSNVCTGGQLLSVESDRNIVDAPGRLVSLLGVNDLIVVEHGESLLVAHKERAQDIRRVVEEVKKVRPDLV